MLLFKKTQSLLSMLKGGFTPTLEDFNHFLYYLSQYHRFKCVIHLFSQMNSNQIKGNSLTNTIFIKALIKDHRYEEASIFLKTHTGKSKVFHHNGILDALIQGFCKNNNDPENGLFVLQNFLTVDGIVPSSFTFCKLIFSFSSQGKMDRVIEVLELMTSEKLKYPFDNFVCSSVISGFVRIGKPELAIGFYENAVKSGSLKANIVTYTALLSAYFRLAKSEEVSDMVSRMEKDGLAFDVVFYSEWISGYFREGTIRDAFRKYREMVTGKVGMDIFSYTILVDGFSKAGFVEKAIGFFHLMIRDGLKPNLITYTATILGFCRKGKLEEAFALFKMVEDFGLEVDEFIYAILIDGVCRSGDFDRAFQLLDGMEKKGIKASVVTYNTFMNRLSKAGRTSEADDVSKDIVGDVVTYSTLLHGYIEEGNTMGVLETERRFKEAGVSMDVVMCNVLIKAFFMLGLLENVLAIYEGMPEMGLAADSITYRTMIDGYCKAGRIDQAVDIFDDFRRTSNSSAACYDCIVRGLCKKGMVDMAIEVFMEQVDRGLPVDKMLYEMLINTAFSEKGGKGVISFVYQMENFGGDLFAHLCNYAINFLCMKGPSDVVFNVFMAMRRNRSFVMRKSFYQMFKILLFDGKKFLIPIILTTFLKQYGMSEPGVNRILVDYLCLKDVNSALKFFTKLKEESLSISFSTTIIETLVKDGRALDAYKLIVGAENKLPHMDMANYRIIIVGLCKDGHVDKALDVCNLVRSKGFSLSIATYNVVINGLCRQGCLVQALRLFDSLEKIDMIPSEITHATVIDALSKEGLLGDARRLFESMLHKNIDPNIRIYNSLIYGYCKFGQLHESLKVLLDMELKGVKPDEFTVSAVMYGYCQMGDMEGALCIFSEFKIKGLTPDFLGFMYLIRGLCAKGRLEDCQSILREMLQKRSIIDLLNRINSEVEVESVQSFLVFLCEQGSIQESVAVLDEIGCVYFPVGRRCNSNNAYAKLSEPCDMEVSNAFESKSLICNNENFLVPRESNNLKVEKFSNTPIDFDEKISKALEFDCYYEVASSLCSKGEINKANKLVKTISGFL